MSSDKPDKVDKLKSAPVAETSPEISILLSDASVIVHTPDKLASSALVKSAKVGAVKAIAVLLEQSVKKSPPVAETEIDALPASVVKQSVAHEDARAAFAHLPISPLLAPHVTVVLVSE